MTLERVEGVSTASRASGEAPVYIMSRKLQKGVRRARKVADRKRRGRGGHGMQTRAAIFEQHRMLRRSVAATLIIHGSPEERLLRFDDAKFMAKIKSRHETAVNRLKAFRREHGLVAPGKALGSTRSRRVRPREW